MSQMLALRRLIKSGLTVHNRKGTYCQTCTRGKRTIYAYNPACLRALESRLITCSNCDYVSFSKDYAAFKAYCSTRYHNINGGILLYQYV